MRNLLLIIALLCITVLTVSAQKTKDAIYLKNGSIIYGQLQDISNNIYRIQTSDGSVFVYESSEVEKYMNDIPAEKSGNKTGFGIGLEAGLLIGSQNSEYVSPFSFTLLGTYKINNIHSFAAGTGVEYLGVSYTPVFLEYKAHIRSSGPSPFVFARMGSLIHLGNNEESASSYYSDRDYKGGIMTGIGTGISWPKDNHEMLLSFAFRYSRTSYTYDDYYSHSTTYESNWRRLELKFGFRF